MSQVSKLPVLRVTRGELAREAFFTITAIGWLSLVESSVFARQELEEHERGDFMRELERARKNAADSGGGSLDHVRFVTRSKEIALKLNGLHPDELYLLRFVLRFLCREDGLVCLDYEALRPSIATLIESAPHAHGDYDQAIHLS